MNSLGLEVKEFAVQNGDFQLDVAYLEVNPGEVVCLMGRSGSGKSTLLNAIAGFLPSQRGAVFSNGTCVSTLYPEERNIALVFQKSALFPHLTVEQNVEFSLKVQRLPKAERQQKTKTWLEKLGLFDLATRRPHEISGGQAQRVALGRAFISGFPVVLFDEPFASLDTSLRRQLRELTRNWVKTMQVSALVVTHDPQEVWQMADRVGFLDQGRLVQVQTPAEAKHSSNPLVRELLGI